MINTDFQLECIYNHHGNIPPVVSMKVCTKDFNEEKVSTLNFTASFHRLVYKDEYKENLMRATIIHVSLLPDFEYNKLSQASATLTCLPGWTAHSNCEPK